MLAIPPAPWLLRGAMSNTETPKYYGYEVDSGFFSVTIYVFRKQDMTLIMRETQTCLAKCTLSQRKKRVAEFLRPYGITL